MFSINGHALAPVLHELNELAASGAIDTTPLRDGPLLFDLSDMDRVRISGRDRRRFLHAMLSNDVENLQEGRGRWATFNDVKGRTQSDVRLFEVASDRKTGHLLALLEPGAAPSFVDGLDAFVISEKVAFDVVSGGGFFLVTGTGAAGVLADLGLPEPGPDLYDHQPALFCGAPVLVLRLDRTGEQGDDIGLWVEPGDEAAVREGLASIPCGDRRVLEAARIENGQPRFGIDITSENVPLESGLKDRAINFEKGCYIGQEVICRIDSMGAPKRRLSMLRCSGAEAPPPGTLLFDGDKEAGWVTSAVASVRSGGVLAMGYVRKRSNEPGTVLKMGQPGGDEEALVERHVGTT